MQRVRDYMNFVKIEHTLFSLPIVYSGTFLARRPWSFSAFIWIFLATLGARSAGMAWNRISDRDLDSENPRTKGREIPTGKIPLGSALAFTLFSSLLFVFSAGMLSRTCLLFSPLPLALFAVYPYLKRWTLWSHLGLGLAWGSAPLGGWLAVHPELTPFSELLPVLLLSFFCVFWVSGFDIIYALQDDRLDRERGLFSMPAVLGEKNALRVSEIAHAIAFLFLGILVQLCPHGAFCYFLLTLAGVLLLASHWKVRTEPLTPPVIDFAFFKVNAVLGFVVFFIVFCSYISPFCKGGLRGI